MWSSFTAGAIAGYGIAIPVGAISILIVNASLRCGFRVGFMAGAGAATVDLIYASLAMLAGAALVVVLEPVVYELRLLSGLLLIGLAVFGLWRGLKPSNTGSEVIGGCEPLKTYWQFTLITLINPMTIVYFTALILGMDSTQHLTRADQLLFVVGAALASLSWQTLIAALGGLGQQHLSDRFQRVAVIFGNLIILVLGAIILYNALQ